MNTLNGKKIIKGICFLLIFSYLFYLCQELVQVKWIWTINTKETANSTSTWDEYRGLEENSVEVLFLGTSHVYSGIDPMYIYEQSGITSYALSGPGMRMDLTYVSLEEALKTQTPKVVLLDMSAVHWKSQQEEAKCHKILDQMPISKTKIEYAFDSDSEEMKPLDVLFPFFRYHSRWSDLNEQDFRYVANDMENTVVRGHFISYRSVPASFHFEEDKKYFLTDRNYKYLQKMIRICEEKNVPLLLYKIPSPTWYRAQSEGVAKLAEEEGLTYLEPYYELEKTGLDASTDFRDETKHLNQYGAEKFCDYLIDYLQEHYEVTDQRATNQQWNEDLKQYQVIKQTLLEKSLEG